MFLIVFAVSKPKSVNQIALVMDDVVLLEFELKIMTVSMKG